MESSERSLRRRSAGERGFDPAKRASARPAKRLSPSAIGEKTRRSVREMRDRECENSEKRRERESVCVCKKKFVEEGFIVLLLFTWKMSRGGTTRESEAALQGNFLAFEVLFCFSSKRK